MYLWDKVSAHLWNGSLDQLMFYCQQRANHIVYRLVNTHRSCGVIITREVSADIVSSISQCSFTGQCLITRLEAQLTLIVLILQAAAAALSPTCYYGSTHLQAGYCRRRHCDSRYVLIGLQRSSIDRRRNIDLRSIRRIGNTTGLVRPQHVDRLRDEHAHCEAEPETQRRSSKSAGGN